MGVKLQSALGGSVELNAPSTASNFTMTVPAGNGTVATTDQLQNFRNRIINGSFDVWQRGTSFGAPAGPAYHADRWQVWYMATARSTDVPAGLGLTYSKQMVATTQASNTFASLEQKVENELTVAGKTVTVSFWIKGTVSGTAVVRHYHQSTNTGFGNTPFSITTGWTKVVVTTTVPNSGAGTKDWTAFGIDFNVGSSVTNLGYETSGVTRPTYTGTVSVTGFQLEIGSTSTNFEYRPIGVELALCQRYYEKSFDLDQAPVNSGSGTTLFTLNGSVTALAQNILNSGATIQFKQTKRAIPTVQQYGNSSGLWIFAYFDSPGWQGGANGGITRIGQSSFVRDQQHVNLVTIWISGHWTASAEL